MAALWHPKILGAHDEVGRLVRFLQRCLAIRNADRAEFIVMRMPGAGRVSNVVEILWRRSPSNGIWT
jgi:hypothetical protein